MPQPRDRSRNASQPSQPSARSAELSRESLAKSLAGFDLIETALDEFPLDELPAAPELPSRREKLAANAARKAARTSSRSAAGAAAHYFSPSAPLAPGQGKGVRVAVAGADIVLRGGAGTFSKSELDEGTQILIETFAASPAFAASGSPHWCDLGCGWGAVACVLATRKPRAKLWVCDINRRAAALALLNVRGLQLPNVAAWNGDGLGSCRSSYFDAVLCNPPVRAGNKVMEKLFQDALRCLKSNGELWIVLRTSQGAKSWHKRLADLFGSCDTMQISHGYRVLRARPGTSAQGAAQGAAQGTAP